ncbi:MAG: hypothetical protein U0836_07540 [Pirellulales bacterium]
MKAFARWCVLGLLFVIVWHLILPSPLALFFRGPREVRVVLPPQFSGAFVVVVDPNGTDLQEASWGYALTVPPSRVARVLSAEPLQEPHKQSWSFGGPATNVIQPTGLPADGDVTLRERGIRSCGGANRLNYFYGTEVDAQAFDYCGIALP